MVAQHSKYTKKSLSVPFIMVNSMLSIALNILNKIYSSIVLKHFKYA